MATTTALPPPSSRGDRWAGPGMLLPFALFYLVFLVGPLVYAVVAGFFGTSLLRSGLGDFAGWSNYAAVLGDSEFWRTLGNTLWFTVLTTVPLVLLSLALALLADRFVRGRWFFRFAFFAPFVLPSAVVSLLFMFIYADQVGLAQSVATSLGVDSPPSWLGDPDWAMVSITVATVWWTIGFNFVLYLAGLQEVPREVHEAAAVDGAGPWQRIRLVVVPMLGRTTTLVTVLQVIASLKVFDQIYMMTGGGPDGSTRPSLQLIYDTGFVEGRVGYASTVSLLLFVVILFVSLVWFALVRRAEKEN
ncbi:sugar ABC transporter permease [Streptomyces sp. NBC_00683]|uniref:carbohydrate ABC transporter permease n=1 Tax=Streptomyces sp. NBC_00683 TaxID=2903670 RepID=UPI002E2F5F94|nr:sugar ABC transporter permease [Streptomyces sp. NBC_00683]